VKFENKGEPPKGGRYLLCDRARRHLGCVNTRWKYDDFEKSFLAFVSEAELPSLVSRSADDTQKLAAEIAVLQGKIAEARAFMEKLVQLLQTGAAVEFVSAKLEETQDALNQKDAELLTKQDELQEIKRTKDRFDESRDEIKALIQKIQAKVDGDSYALRSMVSSRLRSLIDVILVAPAGDAPKILANAEELKAKAGADWADVVRHLIDSARAEQNARAYFSIGFKDGSVRAVTPNPDNPLEYHQQITSKGGELALRIPAGELTLFQQLMAPTDDSGNVE
jgi:hypothetical protein